VQIFIDRNTAAGYSACKHPLIPEIRCCVKEQEGKNMEKDRMEILLEDIQSQLKLVAEGHGILNAKIDGVSADLGNTRQELSGRIDLLTSEVAGLQRRIDSVETQLDQKIDGVETRLTKKIDGVETQLDQKIDGVEIRLTKKIDGVETQLDQKIDGVETRLNEKIEAVAVDLSAHRADTERHAGYRVAEH
jgi:uncharacterized phage infection (PIP) family protein YhgE